MGGCIVKTQESTTKEKLRTFRSCKGGLGSHRTHNVNCHKVSTLRPVLCTGAECILAQWNKRSQTLSPTVVKERDKVITHNIDGKNGQ
jgi:hypothetical protein